jgi:hypothetical protein
MTIVLLFFGWLLLCGSIMDMQHFIKSIPVLKEMKDVRTFKMLVRRQMYIGMALFVVFWAAVMAGIWTALTKQWGGSTALLVIAIALVLLDIATQAFRSKVREQLADIPAQDKGLSSLHQAVCLQWSQRSLPEF